MSKHFENRIEVLIELYTEPYFTKKIFKSQMCLHTLSLLLNGINLAPRVVNRISVSVLLRNTV